MVDQDLEIWWVCILLPRSHNMSKEISVWVGYCRSLIPWPWGQSSWARARPKRLRAFVSRVRQGQELVPLPYQWCLLKYWVSICAAFGYGETSGGWRESRGGKREQREAETAQMNRDMSDWIGLDSSRKRKFKRAWNRPLPIPEITPPLTRTVRILEFRQEGHKEVWWKNAKVLECKSSKFRRVQRCARLFIGTLIIGLTPFRHLLRRVCKWNRVFTPGFLYLQPQFLAKSHINTISYYLALIKNFLPYKNSKSLFRMASNQESTGLLA